MLSETRRERNAEQIGTLLKSAREKAGFTQRALADTIGLEYYTMISQMELGYVSIPPVLWVPLANALHMDRADFVLRCIAAYQPDLYAAIFDNRGVTEVSWFLNAYIRGQLDQYRQESNHGHH